MNIKLLTTTLILTIGLFIGCGSSGGDKTSDITTATELKKYN